MSLDAMKQALEALEEAVFYLASEYSCVEKECEAAITALRAAIEQAQPEMAPAFRSSHAYSVGFMDGQAAQQPEQEPVAWVYPEGLEALKSGRPWTAYGSNGDGRIPLYLNDAVAQKAEPRASGSGAGFDSLPASPQWQGLTDDEREQFRQWAHPDIIKTIELKLQERNT